LLDYEIRFLMSTSTQLVKGGGEEGTNLSLRFHEDIPHFILSGLLLLNSLTQMPLKLGYKHARNSQLI